MPDFNQDVIGVATDLMKRGVIGPSQFQDLVKSLQGPNATQIVPMPKADPRNWVNKLPRLQNRQGDDRQFDPGVVSPLVMYGAKGLDASRKNGDAIDYGGNPQTSNRQYDI